jgi:D-alanyl-D-alanine carboxypeptidase/D-alanyl-D-alanine-endopeptidase (penicillin-binding protein 4)
MQVDPNDALTHEHDGEPYYFCSASCRDKFVREPKAYVGQAADAQQQQAVGSDTIWTRHRGGLRRATLPADGEPALTWRSRPLAEIIRSVNKFSNNVMTRQLLLTLGAESSGAPGSAASGIAAIDGYLSEQGLDSTGLVLDNGAGLSRSTRISAAVLAQVLRIAAQSPYAPEFLASLSLGGLDGTTRNRFRGHPVAGRMHVKTGRLDDVAALAGYVHAASGTNYIGVLMVNSPEAHRGPGEELQEAFVRWIYTLP